MKIFMLKGFIYFIFIIIIFIFSVGMTEKMKKAWLFKKEEKNWRWHALVISLIEKTWYFYHSSSKPETESFTSKWSNIKLFKTKEMQIAENIQDIFVWFQEISLWQ